jgi:hypothetical protein
MDAKHIANGYWQKQPNRAIQNYIFHRSWILHFKKRLAKYSMKTMAAGIKE